MIMFYPSYYDVQDTEKASRYNMKPHGWEFAGPAEDSRAKLIATLSPFMGGDAKAAAFVDGLEQRLREQAAEGAKKSVKPWIIGSLALGALGAALGVYSIWRR